MSLSDLIESDVEHVLLNEHDHGIRAQVTLPSGSTRRVDLLFIETDEQQTIRRGDVTIKADVDLPIGSTFRRHGRVWRFLHEIRETHSAKRWHCHEQLPDMVLILDKTWSKSDRGVDVWTHPNAPPAKRAKIHRSDGEVLESTRRRVMQSDFRIFFEERVRPTTDQVIVDSTGRSYVVRSYEQTEDNTLLTYAICNAADG